MVSLLNIQEAQQRITPYVKRTALERNDTLSDRLGTNLYLKLEIFQKTGSFKVRGAFNKMLTLAPSKRGRGVVAVSGGNHAQAVAYAARTLQMKALILMPETTPANYVEATKAYGAEVLLTDSIATAFAEAQNYKGRGWVYVHPFDDPRVIAGQGTVGLEIIEDLPQVTDVVVSIGGGGLAGGASVALKTLKPEVRVWGVETVGANSMALALEAGKVVELAAITSIARTLGAPAVSEGTLALAQEYLEGVTVVTDAEAVEALKFLAERAKVLTEPAASCTLAAAERLRGQFSKAHHVALILCGGNFALGDLCKFESNLQH